MWFKTTTTGGVLFSYQADPISAGVTSGNYTPALYVDSSGKVRAEFYQGSSASAMTSSSTVNDGSWHHVVLAGAGNTQTLYVDGAAQATLAGTIAMNYGGAAYEYVGAGFVGGGWPNHPNTGLDGDKGFATYFNGSIADVAFFNQALTASTVTALHNSGSHAHGVLAQVTRPSGGVTAQVAYEKTTGQVASVTDHNGGVWTLGSPTVAGSSDVYAASVLGAKPADYWRLGDVDATEPANEVRGGAASYSNVTLGGAGPFSDSVAPSFNATTSYVRLPDSDIPTTGPDHIRWRCGSSSPQATPPVVCSTATSTTR